MTVYFVLLSILFLTIGALFGFFVHAILCNKLCEKFTEDRRMQPIQLRTLVSQYRLKLPALPANRNPLEDYCLFMCNKILLQEVQGEKAQRWLGFIQCLLWISGHYTIDKLREQTRLALEDL